MSCHHVTDIPGDVNGEDMQALLQTNIPGMGVISVDRTGDCSAPVWPITWLTVPGELPLLEVSVLLACHSVTLTVACYAWFIFTNGYRSYQCSKMCTSNALTICSSVLLCDALVHIVGDINYGVAWVECDSGSEGRDCWGFVLPPSAWPSAPVTAYNSSGRPCHLLVFDSWTRFLCLFHVINILLIV